MNQPMNLSAEAKQTISLFAKKFGIPEEDCVFLYWSGFFDGIIETCQRQLDGLNKSQIKKAA